MSIHEWFERVYKKARIACGKWFPGRPEDVEEHATRVVFLIWTGYVEPEIPIISESGLIKKVSDRICGESKKQERRRNPLPHEDTLRAREETGAELEAREFLDIVRPPLDPLEKHVMRLWLPPNDFVYGEISARLKIKKKEVGRLCRSALEKIHGFLSDRSE